MAPRKTPGSPKPDKLMRDALNIELHQDSEELVNGKKLKKLRVVARALVQKGMEGDVAAIKEINDRMDGKVPQGIAGADGQSPATIILEVAWKGLSERS